MTWLRDRWQPLVAIGGCLVLSLLVFSFGATVLGYFTPKLLALSAKDAPAGVMGSDLISTLLGISALTVGGCFAYLCLPTDRIELRISAHAKVGLSNSLINEVQFLEYYDFLSDDKKTPSQKILKCLLFPRNGLSGWYGLEESDLRESFGSSAWTVLRRFADKHLDVKWLTVLAVCNITAVCLGLVCLCARFLGLWLDLYNAYEAFTIVLLSSINLSTAFIVARLFLGGLSGESAVVESINRCIKEIGPGYKDYIKSRRDAALAEDAAAATDAVAAASLDSTALGPIATTGKADTRSVRPRTRRG